MVCIENGSLVCVKKGANLIRNGEVVAFPTETVYGLGADAFNVEAVNSIFRLKGRPADNPLIVHIDSLEWTKFLYKEIPPWANKMMQMLWPGPLSIILPACSCVPSVVRGGLPTVAVRMPAHPYALKLIKYAGTPIAAPSANLSGKPSPTSARHVFEDFGEDVFIIDGGAVAVGVESTVVDATSIPLKIYRLGAVTPEDIESVTGKPVEIHVKPRDGRPLSPGHAYRHYAPSKPLYVFRDEKTFLEFVRERNPIVIAPQKYHWVSDRFISLGSSPVDAASLLYMALRDADKMEGDIIAAIMVEPVGVGLAVNERMSRAATYILGGE